MFELLSDLVADCAVSMTRSFFKHIAIVDVKFLSLEHGEVVTFGDGANGQLGHGNKLLEISEPYVMKWNQPTKIVQVFCGEGHTAFVSGIYC